MIILSVWKKNLISSLRGEYIDFVISRFTFTIFSMATALVLFRLNKGIVSDNFIQASGSSDYLGYLIVGTALYGTTLGILLNVSRTLMTERREGTLESVLMIPFSRWQYYGGNQLHQLMLSVLDALLAAILGLFLGVHFQIAVTMLLAGLIQMFITLYGISLIISLIMIILKDTFFIQNSIIPVILMIGAYLFPINVLPLPLKIMAHILPIHQGVQMVRDGVLNGVPFELSSDYLVSLIPGLFLLIFGYSLLPYIERRTLEDYLS
jgi:ABC-2 type transport system permease protein